MKTKGALSFRVQCEDCGGGCVVYNTTEEGIRYFRCKDCGSKFKVVVAEAAPPRGTGNGGREPGDRGREPGDRGREPGGRIRGTGAMPFPVPRSPSPASRTASPVGFGRDAR